MEIQWKVLLVLLAKLPIPQNNIIWPQTFHSMQTLLFVETNEFVFSSAHFIFFCQIPFFEVFFKGIRIICLPSFAGLTSVFSNNNSETVKFSWGISNLKYCCCVFLILKINSKWTVPVEEQKAWKCAKEISTTFTDKSSCFFVIKLKE